jgi:hypothetical protein
MVEGLVFAVLFQLFFKFSQPDADPAYIRITCYLQYFFTIILEKLTPA